MLLDFKIGGYCSFSDLQEIYFTAAQGTRVKNTKYESNFSLINKVRIMKSAIIFGANASGKSNLVNGVERFLEILNQGLQLPEDFQKNDLNNTSSEITFEANLLSKDSKIFSYLVSFNKDCLIKEKLLLNGKVVYSFDNNTLESKNKNIPKEVQRVFSVKSTQTMLRKLKDYNIQEIEDFLLAASDIIVRKDYQLNKENIFFVDEERKVTLEKEKDKIIEVLKLIDISVKDFTLQKNIEKDGTQVFQVVLIRENIKYEDVYYPLKYESEGIKKIMSYILDILGIFNGKTLLIDELDSSISTSSLIKIFNNMVNIRENIFGQLIVTSHNLFLFNNNVFEPQQIYIVNKKDDLSSEIYSLGDFDVRSEKENLYHDFLKGKFGGMNV